MKRTCSEAYDHSNKIGNEGDTVKHAVLARLTELILSEIGSRSFVYAESHTGRRDYRLPKDGEWENGIRQFSAGLQRLKEQASEHPAQRNCENIQAYVRACFQNPIEEGASYPGSSGLVDLICRERGVVPRFHLCDTDEDVRRELKDSYGNDPHVTIYAENGYEVLPKIEAPSLVLVDPILVKEEARQIRSVLAYLSEKDVDFICWTALWGRDDTFYRGFREEIDKNCSSYWVSWKREKDRTWGCQITVPKKRQDIARDTIDEIREIMRWL